MYLAKVDQSDLAATNSFLKQPSFFDPQEALYTIRTQVGGHRTGKKLRHANKTKTDISLSIPLMITISDKDYYKFTLRPTRPTRIARQYISSNVSHYYNLTGIFQTLFNILDQIFVDQDISINPPQKVKVGPVVKLHLMLHTRPYIWQPSNNKFNILLKELLKQMENKLSYLLGCVPIIIPPVQGHRGGDLAQVVHGGHQVAMVLCILSSV